MMGQQLGIYVQEVERMRKDALDRSKEKIKERTGINSSFKN